MLSRTQRFFVWFCRWCLGITYFKTYWPVGGSYWNRAHINRHKRSDLEGVISDANEYTRQHVMQTFFVVLACIATSVSGDVPSYQQWSLALILLTEAYAFAAHHYNRVLARHAIAEKLRTSKEKKNEPSAGSSAGTTTVIGTQEKKVNEDDEDMDPTMTASCVQIWDVKGESPVSAVYIVRPYEHLSPYMRIRDDAVAYRAFVLSKLPPRIDGVWDGFFTKKYTKQGLYRQWLESRMQQPDVSPNTNSN